jgi:DNA-directed RNA polymerase subunit RPC12/RpoP
MKTELTCGYCGSKNVNKIKVNHLTNFLFSVISCGLLSVFWLSDVLVGKYQCNECGKVARKRHISV